MWQEGRQGSGYLKRKLFESTRFKFDVYLLKYPTGSYINWHTDPVIEGYEHHRLNIVLKKAVGGWFATQTEDAVKYCYGRINLFRPDITRHKVTQVTKGTRWVFSIGWLKIKK